MHGENNSKKGEMSMCMDCQISIIIISLVLVSICCIVWLGKEFTGLIKWMVARALKELEEDDE